MKTRGRPAVALKKKVTVPREGRHTPQRRKPGAIGTSTTPTNEAHNRLVPRAATIGSRLDAGERFEPLTASERRESARTERREVAVRPKGAGKKR